MTASQLFLLILLSALSTLRVRAERNSSRVFLFVFSFKSYFFSFTLSYVGRSHHICGFFSWVCVQKQRLEKGGRAGEDEDAKTGLFFASTA